MSMHLVAMGAHASASGLIYLKAGLVAAYEARAATPDVNGHLHVLPDLSGNGNDATVLASIGSRPVLATNVLFNDQVTAAFAGTSGHVAQRATWVGGIISQPNTVYWVGAQPNVGGVRLNWDGGTASNRQIGYKLAAGFAIAALSNVTTTNTSTAPIVQVGLFDNASSQIFLNEMGTPAGSGTAGANGLNGITIAGANTPSPNSQTFAALYAYEGKHTQSQREAMITYINNEFGVGTLP